MAKSDDDFRVNIEIVHEELESDPEQTVARMLGDVAKRVANGEQSGLIKDINGNTVGSFEFD